MPTKPSQREYEAVARLRTALRRFLRQTDGITRAHGLTPQRYDLLAVIRSSRTANLSIREIADQLSLEPHSVTELVDRAEQAGLVRRLGDDNDRRIARVTLTTQGAERLAAAVSALGPERRRLLSLLHDVYEQAEQLQPGRRRPK